MTFEQGYHLPAKYDSMTFVNNMMSCTSSAHSLVYYIIVCRTVKTWTSKVSHMHTTYHRKSVWRAHSPGRLSAWERSRGQRAFCQSWGDCPGTKQRQNRYIQQLMKQLLKSRVWGEITRIQLNLQHAGWCLVSRVSDKKVGWLPENFLKKPYLPYLPFI